MPKTPETTSPADLAQEEELVALFKDRPAFDTAVKALLEAGFKQADLSILTSHESLSLADEDADDHLPVTALLPEINYIAPATAAGLIALAGGPIIAPIAALVAGAVGVLALSDYIGAVTSYRDAEDVARAVQFGALLLWVRVPDEESEEKARKILKSKGGTRIHKMAREP